MIHTYEKLSTLFRHELFLCPIDYPYLYSEPNKTDILIGNTCHWKRIDQTLCAFLTSNQMIKKHFNELTNICEKESKNFLAISSSFIFKTNGINSYKSSL